MKNPPNIRRTLTIGFPNPIVTANVPYKDISNAIKITILLILYLHLQT